jgi:hypothetical protein
LDGTFWQVQQRCFANEAGRIVTYDYLFSFIDCDKVINTLSARAHIRFAVVALLSCTMTTVSLRAFDHGFDHSDAVVRWFDQLRRPDVDESYLGVVSCCGLGEAYPAELIVDGGHHGEWVARITDGSEIEFPDGTWRPPLPDGTVVHFPAAKVTRPDQGNPTKRAWLFLSAWGGEVHEIWCFVPLPPDT